MKFAVLNPGGSDPDQAFPHFAGAPGEKSHPPVNYHAYAACTAGSFHRNPSTIPDDGRPVLLLLRRDLTLGLKTLAALQQKGRVVAISLKESGSHQVVSLLTDRKRLMLFHEICARADLCLSSTSDLLPLYLGAGARRAEFVPTPYPLEDSRWDFSLSIEPAVTMGDRRGIFIGTREFDTPSRNHLAAVLAVKRLGEPVTVVNTDGRRGRRILETLGFRPADGQYDQASELRMIEGQMAYPRYLQIVAGHRLVFQLDRSAVPGQVAGDALLCRVPCVGGDGAVERLAFPGLCGFGREPAELLDRATTLLRDDGEYARAIEESQRFARERLAFSPVAERLRGVFATG